MTETTTATAPETAEIIEIGEQFKVQLHPEMPVVSLLPHQLIWDDEFNYTRKSKNQLHRFDLDGKAPGAGDRLEGAIGGDSCFDHMVQDPVVRFADQDERARWWELHQHDDAIQALPEAERMNAIPTLILVDGFGRVEEEWRLYPNTALKMKLLNTADRWVGVWSALILNNTQRPNNPIDLADSLKGMMKHFGWNQAELSRRTGWSKAHITQIMKCHRLTLEERQKARENHWSLFKIRQYVDQRDNPTESKKSPKPESMKGKLRETIKENINLYLDSKVFKEGTYQHGFVAGFLAAMEFEDGNYSTKDTLEDVLEHVGDVNIDKFPHPIDEKYVPPVEEASDKKQPKQDTNKGKKQVNKKAAAKKTQAAKTQPVVDGKAI